MATVDHSGQTVSPNPELSPPANFVENDINRIKSRFNELEVTAVDARLKDAMINFCDSFLNLIRVSPRFCERINVTGDLWDIFVESIVDIDKDLCEFTATQCLSQDPTSWTKSSRPPMQPDSVFEMFMKSGHGVYDSAIATSTHNHFNFNYDGAGITYNVRTSRGSGPERAD
ncbi:hypothetical protein K435DRAFT_805181 [Dendrothele bispora CBS 962.96]|uniref:Uncharacterized protein n=1 Tax=Dendrothele bispora (strain CBS 962.96) TaxID=1314807 RepID=A0A4S8LCA1_DENBC|nr:hypothetical protein K435DRAFT_805181 [Dendrothele bispora CBS 962.96]